MERWIGGWAWAEEGQHRKEGRGTESGDWRGREGVSRIVSVDQQLGREGRGRREHLYRDVKAPMMTHSPLGAGKGRVNAKKSKVKSHRLSRWAGVSRSFC